MRLLNKAFVRLTALAIAFSLAPSAFALDGSQVVTGGGSVDFTGASSTNWVVNPETGELDFLIAYSNATETAASFSFNGLTSARILAVGGGGGGGAAYRMGFTGTRGGGGGGAGGFVETEGLYDKGTFDVTVGEGGKAGAMGMVVTALAGGDGSNTTVTVNGAPLITAYGGGGGGGECDGRAGGSGGGGSQANGGTPKEGGKVLDLAKAEGQGHAGGAGDAALYGGGGGGAGADGTGTDGTGFAASTAGGGRGGDGRESDITGTPTFYAGGGGGGWSSSSTTVPKGLEKGIPGGKGGGGAGGVARNKNINPVAGLDGFGGGGGGCNGNNAGVTGGAKGGCGVVIVRVIGSLNGALDKPKDTQVEWDGAAHNVVTPAPFYTIEGDNSFTDTGVYTVKVTPIEGLVWADSGTREAVTVTLTIYQKDSISGTEYVTGAPVSFYGATATNWVSYTDSSGNARQDLVLTFTNAAAFKLPGASSARILAVGGGGGGGAAYRMGFTGTRGGGGGGGAGGFVETEALYGKGTYAIAVGKGGKAGAMGMVVTALAGGDGGDTTIVTNGFPLITAYGGGGGGGECTGHNGGSGGGGSQKNGGTAQDGGTNLVEAVGQGHNGGAGDAALYGGGGGGAGANGTGTDGTGFAASTAGGGRGGDGRASDITGTSTFYAGGGGGGWSSSSTTVPTGLENGIPGGKGGGGAGGVARNKGINPVAGLDGFGGGGGGCNGNNAGVTGGAKGGCGVVIVRISSAMEGEFKRPQTEYAFTYDETEHFSVKPNVFYDVTGEYIGTTAGVYRAHVKLHDGVVWPEGDKEELDVTMTIKRLPVEITELSTEGWTFHDETMPDPAVAWTTDPEESHDLVHLVLEYKANAEGGTWSADKPTHAGSYLLRARSADTNNFDCAEKTFEFEVKKLTVTFSDLSQLGWMSGTPAADTPNPSCSVDPDWIVKVYEYESETEPGTWTTTKPTTPGEHKVRVRCLNDDDYAYNNLETTFDIINGLGGIYHDYVEITIGLYLKSPTLTNFPLVVSLSESSPIGFLYERAGSTGEDLTFTDASGDVILPYQLITWDTNGTSQVYVRIPELTRSLQKIRLYWKVREGVNPPSHEADKVWEYWTEADWNKISKPGTSYLSPVSRDGKFIDYWTQQPAMSATFWDTQDDLSKKGTITRAAKLKFNTPTWYVTNLVSGVTWAKPANDFPATLEGGIYRLVYELVDETGAYLPLETHVDFTIHGHSPWDDLRGDAKSLTLAGRVMLANNDCVGGHEVTDQGYWQTREVVTNATTGATLTNDVFWIHGTEEHGTYSSDKTITHMMPGTTHKLCYVGEEADEEGVLKPAIKTLWRFQDVIVGNIQRDDLQMRSSQCVLPWSSTGLGITSYENRNVQGNVLEAGSLILRNLESAVVYSPCYTNGLGTIYFDAVNSDSNRGADSHHIIVEVATETEDGFAPTDENAKDESRSDIGGELGKITNKQWVKKTMQAFFYDGTDFSSPVVSDEVALNCTTGNSTNRFYRIAVPINIRKPVRFRIRRATTNPDVGEDNLCLILLDNIICSYPQMGADIVSGGRYDKNRTKDETLGWENAMIPPFPALTDREIYGRGKAETYVNESTNANPKGFIQRSTMWYRWRYLDQLSNDWQSVELQPGDDFVAKTPLVLPRREGDVEYWFESLIDVPYYEYFDYSGLNVGLKDAAGKALFTEDRSVVTNRLSETENWFFRYRPGRLVRDAECYKIYYKTAETAPEKCVEMSVAGDGLLRGYVQTLEKLEGEGLYVRFEELNRQTPGAAEFATNVTHWALANDVGDLAKPVELVASTGDWSRVVCDAKTGYLLFQVTEATRTLMIVHADRQNFNQWNDANRTDRLFVGTAMYTNDTEGTVAGASARAQTYRCDLDRWHLSNATNALWTEHFKVTKEEMTTPGGYWEVNQPFSKKTTPNRLQAGPGQWVPSYYRDYGSGMAFQMEGCGKGYLQFVDVAEKPRGLESVALNVRLAQPVVFGDFAYYGGTVRSLTNYTFYCRGAYDVFKRTSFAGNASLSLVAFYRAGEGGYELRVEQDNAKLVGDKVTGPGDTQRLTLYRWNYVDDEDGEVKWTRLGETTINNASTLTTDGEEGDYGLLFISAKDTGTKTEIVAGLSKDCKQVDNISSTTCLTLSYRDASSDRIVNGTYGVLSANCAARFRYLNYLDKAQTCTVSEDNAATASTTFSFAPAPNGVTRTTCQNDINNGGWVNAQRRMVKTDMNTGTMFGLKAKEVSQSVTVAADDTGSGSFDTVITNIVISNFGALDPVTVPLWTTKDCTVQVSVGGKATSMRTDIVIDDFEFRQWRGESYDDKEGAKYFPSDMLGYGCPTNFVFTYAWNKLGFDAEGAVSTNCQLCAKRARPGEAVSVRSPLFDDGGDEARGTKRGVGLGRFEFTYANAQTNVNLLLQISTNNNVSLGSLATLTKSLNTVDWQTVTNYSFAACSEEELKKGSRACYIGLHGVKGVMRLVMDPAVITSVTNATDETAFGSIDITGVLCSDEPPVDEKSWWGWNMQTTDEAERRNLWDETPTGLDRGLACALNNSLTDRVLAKDEKLYPRHLPFLQTPTFAENVVGEVRFRARKYSKDDPTARVTLFGARTGGMEDDHWTKVTSWDITNVVYETYSFKTKAAESYAAFRFVVTGVAGVELPKMDDDDPLVPPQRVLLDDVCVLEAIRAHVSFRNVAAFRGYLDTNLALANVTDRSFQPLCRESFSVQAEVFAAQLADEVDLSTAEVTLWWYVGDEPWGFDRWKSSPQAHHAKLAPCAGTNLVFRGSYEAAPEAVIPEEDKFTAVQYMLVATYRNQDGTEGATYLSEADWPNPSWYSPVDYNAKNSPRDEKGEYEHFSAYTLLDTVASGWAWINEVNIFGSYSRTGANTDKPWQFVEIAAPAVADLSKWKLVFLDGVNGSDLVITNVAATFGLGGPAGLKDQKFMDPDSKCVFHVVASPEAKTAGSFDAAKGEIDGVWKVREDNSAVSTTSDDGKSGGEIGSYYPIAIQLVRPSGIVEHEIVASGTNRYAHLEQYNPELKVEYLKRMGCANIFYVGQDNADAAKEIALSSLGSMANRGYPSSVFETNWANDKGMTPGRKNEGETIEGEPPEPLGSSVRIYAMVEGDHIWQTFGTGERTTEPLSIVFRKGSETGTNITYTTDRWYVPETTNGTPVRVTATNFVLEVGKGVSNSLTVVAKAVQDPSLDRWIGPDNRYGPAIVDWLSKGVTKFGPFHNPDFTEPGIGDFYDVSGTKVTNLTLTTMYWLDMDPSWPDGVMSLMGGMVGNPPVEEKKTTWLGRPATNRLVHVMMAVTNTETHKAWSPYILRDAQPGVTSWDYAQPEAKWGWSNVTFKVTGILVNDLSGPGLRDRESWKPLRYFVFNGMMSGAEPYSLSFDAKHQSTIEIPDPYLSVPMWQQWLETHGGDRQAWPIWHRWDLDNRITPSTVEILRPSSNY